MVKNIFIAIFLFSLMSCGYSGACCKNLMGNISADSGKYDKAALYYGKAEKYKKTKVYTEYNKALLYLLMGEEKAAETKFSSILKENVPDVNYRAMYALGIISYRNNDFKKAAECFRDALKIDNSDIKLKKNLELSLEKLSEKTKAENTRALIFKKKINEKDNKKEILNFLFGKEVPSWAASAHTLPEDGEPDL